MGQSGTLEARRFVHYLENAGKPIVPADGLRLLPSGVHSLLRMGIRKKLKAKFEQHFPGTGDLVASAIVKSVLGEQACDSDLASYIENNALLIEQLAQLIHTDYPLAHAFSVLLSFTLVQLGPKYPKKSAALTERTIELHLILRSTLEIVPTHDAREWLDGVQRIAQNLLLNQESLF